MLRSKGRSRFIALCVVPAALLFTVFMIVPTLNVFRMSLFERGAYSPTETFVGLGNFKILFNDAKFITSMQNTILLIVVVTLITFFFAIVSSSTSPTSCPSWSSPAFSPPFTNRKTEC